MNPLSKEELVARLRAIAADETPREEHFGAMCYILKTLDMYTAACTIVNSLPSVYLEPTFVKNLVYYNPEMTSKVEDTSKIEGVSSKGNRVPPGLKKKTTIDDLG